MLADLRRRVNTLGLVHQQLMHSEDLGDQDGVYAAQEIHKRRPTPVVFITGSMEQQTVDRIRQDHPADIFFKPVLPQHPAAAVKKQLS